MNASAYSFTSDDWCKILIEKGQSEHALKYWLEGLYKSHEIWKKHINLEFKESLNTLLNWNLPSISAVQTSSDETVKFQMKLEDGLEVETVIIPFHKRMTVCLSTQVGCAMNCSFCYTGTQGLKRNLTTGEIVGQYIVAKKYILENSSKHANPSIVFMGQGEPLHNSQNVLKAIQVFNDPKILGVGLRQMTLSTVGYLPGMEKLSDFPQINFALSLHSPFDHERSELIPVNQNFPLARILLELDKIPLQKNQYLTYEYLLIKNFNMTEAHAVELQNLLGIRKAILNLIPFNPFPGSKWERPSDEEIETFKNSLVDKKLRVMVRTSKGQDILAACGQLKIQNMTREKYARS